MIPDKFTDPNGVDWVVSARFPLKEGETEYSRLIATDKPVDDYNKRDMRMIYESELRALLPNPLRNKLMSGLNQMGGEDERDTA